jgi:predicted DNA-binding transcriptional regulator YafY
MKTKVVIAVQKEVVSYLGEGKKYYGFVSEEQKEHEVEMTFMARSIEGLARWYLMFGAEARILEPESFKLKVKELAEKTLAHVSS